jgi:hypothetical protein
MRGPATLLLAAGLFLPGPGCARARLPLGGPDARAIQEITRLGGRYELDAAAAGQPLLRADLAYTPVTDDDLAALQGLSRLRSLNLDGAGNLSDKGLEHLKDLASLRSLSLASTAVTDAGLERLQGLKELRTLNLWETHVSDTGVHSLRQKLPKVNVLR